MARAEREDSMIVNSARDKCKCMWVRDFRAKECCVSVEKLLWCQLILEREYISPQHLLVPPPVHLFFKMGRWYIDAQLCCMCWPTCHTTKFKGRAASLLQWHRRSSQRGQTDKKRELEYRSIIHRLKRWWGFGSLSPLSAIFRASLISMSHLKVSGSEGSQSHHLKCHRLVLSQKLWCHSALDLVVDRDGCEREEGH